jgi:DNA polymerase-3 subunit delta'
LHGKELDFCKKFAPFVHNANIEALTAETDRALGDVARNGNPKILFTHYALTVSKLINKMK